jgi:hypothetical protein
MELILSLNYATTVLEPFFHVVIFLTGPEDMDSGSCSPSNSQRSNKESQLQDKVSFE